MRDLHKGVSNGRFEEEKDNGVAGLEYEKIVYSLDEPTF